MEYRLLGLLYQETSNFCAPGEASLSPDGQGMYGHMTGRRTVQSTCCSIMEVRRRPDDPRCDDAWTTHHPFPASNARARALDLFIGVKPSQFRFNPP